MPGLHIMEDKGWDLEKKYEGKPDILNLKHGNCSTEVPKLGLG